MYRKPRILRHVRGLKYRSPDRSELIYPENFAYTRDPDHSPDFSATLQESGYQSIQDYDHETYTSDADFGTHFHGYEEQRYREPEEINTHHTRRFATPGPTSSKEMMRVKTGQWYHPMEGGVHSYSGRGPKGYARSDARILEEVCELLTEHSGIDASNIEVKVARSVVRLIGTVETRRMKRLVEDVVETVPGVSDIQNFLKVESLNYPMTGPSAGTNPEADLM